MFIRLEEEMRIGIMNKAYYAVLICDMIDWLSPALPKATTAVKPRAVSNSRFLRVFRAPGYAINSLPGPPRCARDCRTATVTIRINYILIRHRRLRKKTFAVRVICMVVHDIGHTICNRINDVPATRGSHDFRTKKKKPLVYDRKKLAYNRFTSHLLD